MRDHSHPPTFCQNINKEHPLNSAINHNWFTTIIAASSLSTWHCSIASTWVREVPRSLHTSQIRLFRLSTFLQEEKVALGTTGTQHKQLVCHLPYPQLTGQKLRVEVYPQKMLGRGGRKKAALKTQQLSTSQKLFSLMATRSLKLSPAE